MDRNYFGIPNDDFGIKKGLTMMNFGDVYSSNNNANLHSPTTPFSSPNPSSYPNKQVTINPNQPISNIIKTEKSDPYHVLRQVFNYFDISGNGKINSSELDRVFAKLNSHRPNNMISETFKQGDRNLSRDLEFPEFLQMNNAAFTGDFKDDEIEYAFRKFDMNNDGYITVASLSHFLNKIGLNYTDKQIESLIRLADLDRDGKLNFQEYSRLIRANFK